MANYQEAAPKGAPNVATMANWAGAVVSLALIIGVGVWGYRLLARDVSGIPVVRAAEGPMRDTPKNPGGRPAEHQGLAVNAVAGHGTAAPPADTLLLAPKPLDLTDEDQPLATISAPAPLKPRDAVQQDLTLAAADPSDDPVQALANSLAAGASPLAALPDADEDAPDVKLSVGEIEDTAAPAFAGGVARSLRPMVRPKTLNTQVASLAPALPEPKSIDVDPASIPAGTALAQLGAYDSVETAQKEWDRFNARFSDFLDGKQRVIQKASSGGRTFYRLRAMGFDEIGDARRFCSALVAGNAECIPVTTR
ncbi:SPOR domain-containing protein [Mesobacterium sp. TK19101]|uniref:SPOR domain-containing protein n=1 Tax=Mesobacterium hydrothermale TaxID=3111907 RepID=A0ABU6HDS5_9RHOB|nr:SPOR domain-containing protein [Mesobacterium sp. TK19101]MEC3860610.1 SPOR domain-containing protein [Mesobacterium sp. TK19101]